MGINLEGETANYIMNHIEYIKIMFLLQNSEWNILLGPLCYFLECFRVDIINFTGLFTHEIKTFFNHSWYKRHYTSAHYHREQDLQMSLSIKSELNLADTRVKKEL